MLGKVPCTTENNPSRDFLLHFVQELQKGLQAGRVSHCVIVDFTLGDLGGIS